MGVRLWWRWITLTRTRAQNTEKVSLRRCKSNQTLMKLTSFRYTYLYSSWRTCGMLYQLSIPYSLLGVSPRSWNCKYWVGARPIHKMKVGGLNVTIDVDATSKDLAIEWAVIWCWGDTFLKSESESSWHWSLSISQFDRSYSRWTCGLSCPWAYDWKKILWGGWNVCLIVIMVRTFIGRWALESEPAHDMSVSIQSVLAYRGLNS